MLPRVGSRPLVSSSLCISLALAILVWLIFYPGTLSADSLYTYKEALAGEFSDVRPPFITFILHLFLKFNEGLGAFTLLESLLGFLGARRLLLAVSSSLHVNGSQREWIASTGLLLLASPLTPMPVYFITVWVDSWLVIFLLWTVALLLEIANRQNSPLHRWDWSRVIAVLFLITLVMLTRWNSVLLAAPLLTVLSVLLWRRNVERRAWIALACSPLVAYICFLFFQYQVVGVQRIYAERFVYALDLASMITYDSRVCELKLLESCQLIEGQITSMFVAGDGAIDHTMNQGLSTVEPAFAALRILPTLPKELQWAALNFPRTFVAVKLLNFVDYLKLKPRYSFQSFIHRNGFGIYSNEQFRAIRTAYVQSLYKIYTHPILKLFFFAHITWLSMNVFIVVCCFLVGRTSEAYTTLGLLLLTPMVYYFSYLIALTSSDFRYMYPATLLMQVLTVGVVASCIAKRFRIVRANQPVNA